MPRGQRAQRGGELLAQGRGARDQLLRLQDLEHRQSRGGAHRVPGQGQQRGPGGRRPDPPGRQHGGQGQSAAQALAQGHHIREHSLGAAGQQRPGAAHAHLDLIDHQQRAGAIAGLPQPGEEVRGRDDQAAVGHDRLHDHGREAPGLEHGGSAHSIAVGSLLHSGIRRYSTGDIEAGGVLGRAETAVVRVLEDQDAGPFRPGADRPQGRRVGVRAGQTQVHGAGPQGVGQGHRLQQALGQPGARGVRGRQDAHARHARRLRGHCLHDPRMRVSHGGGAPPRGEVDQLTARRRAQDAALRRVHLEREEAQVLRDGDRRGVTGVERYLLVRSLGHDHSSIADPSVGRRAPVSAAAALPIRPRSSRRPPGSRSTWPRRPGGRRRRRGGSRSCAGRRPHRCPRTS